MTRVLLAFLMRRHWWTCGLCVMLPVMIGSIVGVIYPTMEKERSVIGPMLDLMRNWFPELPNFLRPEGAFVWPYMHPMTLLAYVLAPAIVALAQPAGERGRGSLDLILATRLSRSRLVSSVFLFLVPVSIVMGLGPFLGSVIGSALCGELGAVPLGAYLLCSVEASALSLFFGSLALLVSVRSRDRGQATLVFAAITIGWFLVDVVSQMWKDAPDWVARAGPFGYYDPLGLAREQQVPLALDLFVLLGGVAVCVGCAIWSARRRRSA